MAMRLEGNAIDRLLDKVRQWYGDWYFRVGNGGRWW